MHRIPAGLYPMLYAFFDHQGILRLDALKQQVDAALASDAAGIAVLGLLTEATKLSLEERLSVVEEVSEHLAGAKPLLVTVSGDTIDAQIQFANNAIDIGASALLLQPPPDQSGQKDLVTFYTDVIGSIDGTVGIQNAPDFLDNALSQNELIDLATRHDNFTIAKLECSAVALAEVAAALPDRVAIFNGRCGLELTDNMRAGADGLIPGPELIDQTNKIHRLFIEGEIDEAEALYAKVLPALCFLMQGIPHLVTYGKMFAAMRLGCELGGVREPHQLPTDFGKSCVQRFAQQFGNLL